MDIPELLGFLGGLFPISANFCKTLETQIQSQNVKHKEQLLSAPARAKKTWFLLEGIVVASILGISGKEIVLRIYLPGMIFSDLDSFLHGKASSISLTVINGAKLQFITREDFILKMMPFPETQHLKDKIIFLDSELDRERSLLLDLPEQERFAAFARSCPIMNQLPNVTGASYLNISTSRYCSLKAKWNSGI